MMIEPWSPFAGGEDCGFVKAEFVPPASVPAAAPAGYDFPHGLLTFALANWAPAAP